MLIVLVGLYAFACVTGSRTWTLALGTAFAALLHPAAALTALVIALVAYVAPRTALTARLYAFMALAIIVAKNSLAPEMAMSLVGVSFVIFQGYYSFVQPPRSPAGIPVGAAQLVFYPQLLCGPIIPPKAYRAERARHMSPRKAQYAHCLFAAGMILKIWCSDTLASVTSGQDTGVFHGLLLLLQLYGDFAGWCLMGSAIGLACGIAIPRNFRYPFRQSVSTKSWRAWNTSLNQWVRTALPLRAMAPRLGRFGGVLIYCAVLALWHGLFANFLFYMAVTLVILLWQERLRSTTWLRLSQLLLYLSIGFAFFNRVPNTWLGLSPGDVDNLLLAGVLLVAFEAGAIRRVFTQWRLLDAHWWLMPTLITLLFALRPVGKAFMYTRF
jgi:hypothetical protein